MTDRYGIYLSLLAALLFFAWSAAPWIDSLGAEPINARECPKEPGRVRV